MLGACRANPMPTAAQLAEIDKYKGAYESPRYRMSEARSRSIKQTLQEVPWRGSYLDVSCGRGEMLGFAHKIGFSRVAGTEVVPELIGGEVVHALAWDLPFADGSFEVVSFLDVIEHLLPGDDELACRELARVATRAILLTANNLSSHPKYDPSIELHCNKRPYHEWARLLCAWFAGADVVWRKDRVANRSELWLITLR